MLLLVVAPLPSHAQISVSAEVGWGGLYRVGRWTPIFLTLDGPDEPQQVQVELSVPVDLGQMMRVRQDLVIGPTPTTYALYAPLADEYMLGQSSLTIREAETGRKLHAQRLFQETDRPESPIRQVYAGVNLVGISGRTSDAPLVVAQVHALGAEAGVLSPQRLPTVATGYDALGLLVLAAPDLSQVLLDQQKAIVSWVRAGGTVVIWPGADPWPGSGPLVDALPGRVGEVRMLSVPADQLSAVGLSERFASLIGRAVTPVASAEPIALFDGAIPPAYAHRLGFGQIILLHFDASSLIFTDPADANRFWRPILGQSVELPPLGDDALPTAIYGTTSDRLREEALLAIAPHLGTKERSGTGLSPALLAVLLGVLLIAGPVDSLVLWHLGRRQWTLTTIVGWLGVLVVGAALVLSTAARATTIQPRTIRLIDQADGTVEGIVEVRHVTVPRRAASEGLSDTDQWWRPLIISGRASEQLLLELPVRQDQRGTRPADDPVFHRDDEWTLEAHTFASEPGVIDAALSVTTDAQQRVVGRLSNLSGSSLRNVVIETAVGAARLGNREVAPGERVEIDLPLSSDPTTRATTLTAQSIAGMAADRSVKLQHLVRNKRGVVIYGDVAGETDDATFVRAFVPVPRP